MQTQRTKLEQKFLVGNSFGKHFEKMNTVKNGERLHLGKE